MSIDLACTFGCEYLFDKNTWHLGQDGKDAVEMILHPC